MPLHSFLLNFIVFVYFRVLLEVGSLLLCLMMFVGKIRVCTCMLSSSLEKILIYRKKWLNGGWNQGWNQTLRAGCPEASPA